MSKKNLAEQKNNLENQLEKKLEKKLGKKLGVTLGKKLRETIPNKLPTKSIFQFIPEGTSLLRHETGDLELNDSDKLKKYSKLSQNIAYAVNEYIVNHHPGVLAHLRGSEMLRANNSSGSYIYFNVFTEDSDISDELIKELELVARKYFASIFCIDDDKQYDMFEESLGTLDSDSVNIDCLSGLKDDFVKKNRNWNLNTPITITSDFNTKPIKVYGTINKPVVKPDTNNAKTQTAYYELISVDRKDKKLRVHEVLFHDTNTPSLDNPETLIAVDTEIINEAFRTESSHFFFSGETTTSGTTDNIKPTKYLTTIKAWEGPKLLF